jgi:GH43 family beta-xylosidase
MPRRFTNPVIGGAGGADHGDPFVLRHQGEYFLYHTTDDGDRGISVHRSRDLVRWSFAGHALEPAGWAQTDIWAPEVVHAGGEFLMYVSGTTLAPDGTGVEAERRQGLARARDPLGPFQWDEAPLVRDTWSIDGHPFRAADGGDWLFYNVRTPETRFEGHSGSGNVVIGCRRPTGSPGRRASPGGGRAARTAASLLHALLPAGTEAIRVDGEGEVTDLVATARVSP